MPSTPRSTTARASSRVWMPLTTSLPGHCDLIHARSSNVTVGSNIVSSYFADGARPAIQRRERQRLGGQQVEPPARAPRRVEHGPQRQRRRNRHPVADVAQPRAGDRHVDGGQQGVEAGLAPPARPVPSTGPGHATCRAETTCGPAAQRLPRLRSRPFPASTARTGCRRRGGPAPAISPSVCISRVKPVGAMPNGTRPAHRAPASRCDLC